jgi:hypothetical protein
MSNQKIQTNTKTKQNKNQPPKYLQPSSLVAQAPLLLLLGKITKSK